MISVTELRAGTTFSHQDQIYQVLSYEHIKMGRGSANVKVRAKNLRTGATVEKSFISGAEVEEINLTKKKVQFLYVEGQNFHFMDSQTFEQFELSANLLGPVAKFLKEGMEVTLLAYQEEPLALALPPKMKLKVKETGPGIRGDSATNIFKEAILENELKVKVPLFIKEGDTVVVDTRTGEYAERVSVRGSTKEEE